MITEKQAIGLNFSPNSRKAILVVLETTGPNNWVISEKAKLFVEDEGRFVDGMQLVEWFMGWPDVVHSTVYVKWDDVDVEVTIAGKELTVVHFRRG